jgi:hypothetical protein
MATLRDGQRKAPSPNGEAVKTQADAAAMFNIGKRSVERAREVAEKADRDVVHAVKRGAVKVSAAAEFAKEPRIKQRRLIVKYGSAAAAVRASKADVKAKADRAAHKISKPLSDPKRAADRAEAVRAYPGRLVQRQAMLQTFLALNRLGEPGDIAEAITRLDADADRTKDRLRQLVGFAGGMLRAMDH